MRTQSKTTKLPKARERAGNQVVIGLNFHLIGWESGACFLDQSPSEKQKNASSDYFWLNWSNQTSSFFFWFQLHVNFAQHGATFFAPGSMFSDPTGSRVSTIVYKTLHNVFRLKEKGFSEAQKEGGKLQTIGSSIISATVLPTPKFPLAKPVKLVFKRNNQVWVIWALSINEKKVINQCQQHWFNVVLYTIVWHRLQSRNLIGQCVFWEIGRSQRTWLTRGCTRVDHESNAKVTTCECDHLTIFAILMKNKPVSSLCISQFLILYFFTRYVSSLSLWVEGLNRVMAFTAHV